MIKSDFQQLNLQLKLQKAIDKLGFKQMTPVQQKVLYYTLAGHDAIGLAQTGTGKTATFLITIINELLNNPIKEQRYRGEPRALILAPTRELALQIEQDCKHLTVFSSLTTVTLLGGVDFEQQIDTLNRFPIDIVVATPGRLIDFIEQKEIYLDQLEFLVIDEADRLLDMGFIPAIKRIIYCASPKEARQTLLFSATFNQDVMNLAYRWLYQPVMIEIEPKQKTNIDVEQRLYLVESKDKYRLLEEVLQQEPIEKVMIFANRREQVRDIYEYLKQHQYKVGLLSGEISQDKRLKALERFKQGQLMMMVATDVAGRGIHVDGISHVINFTLPEQPDDYVHRIGRTGRAGQQGVSISFLSEDDAFYLADLEQKIGKKLNITRLAGYC